MNLRSPQVRFWFAIGQLIVCTILWPATVIPGSPLAVDEPFWVLNLSWFAIWQGAFILAVTTEVRVQQEDGA